MLIRFEASNFRSISAPVELSMVAIDHDRPEARRVEPLGEHVVPVAAVYGPNASGKSNVLESLVWLRSAFGLSLSRWDDAIPLDPFAFRSGTRDVSAFRLEMTVDGVRFEYSLEATSDSVVYEGLFHYPERRRRLLFERDGLELKLQRGLGVLSGARKVMTGRTLMLSIAHRFGEPSVDGLARQLGDMQIVRPTRLPQLWPGELDLWDPSLGASSAAARDRALLLLRLADLGIEDVVAETREIEPPRPSGPTGGIRSRLTRYLSLTHQSAAGPTAINFNDESQGTKAWFHLIPPILRALDQGSVLVVDELDTSLHPTLSAEVIRVFQSPVSNPKGAQLLFSSHDTSLLGHLNRDEIWLTEKRPDGSTRLGALAEFAGERVRRSQNLERAYLADRFGALPQIDNQELYHALGLVG
ncbi:MAG: ATP-binding protein [Bifidobacteriaceae bacterium]|nr:ATP-binding protein [Bifidobacteriaceae bacterium]